MLIGVGYTFYAFVRGQVGAKTEHNRARGVAHARDVISIERHLGIFRERAIQRALLHVTWLTQALDSFWAYAYLLVTIAVIIWLLARHPDRFGQLRTAFFLATLVGVGIFLIFPTSPPRFLPASYGIVDTWSTVGGIAAHRPPRIEHISDPLASFPSLHIAWSTWCSITISSITRRRWVKVVAWGYTALTVLAVVASGNHYFLDCAAGMALMLVALWATSRVYPAPSAASESRV